MESSKYKDIFFEYELAVNNSKNQAVIILAGVPSKPKKYDIVDKLVEEGFDVFFPRYEGTWESSGEFLKNNPVDSINTLIKTLSSGINIDNIEFKYSGVYIIASSFGGGIALSLKDEPSIKKVCVVSPVISYRKVVGIETLAEYLKVNYPNDYRFSIDNWNKLVRDEIYNPNITSLPPQKIMIVAGISDDQILLSDLEEYVYNNKITNFSVEDLGHISISKIVEPLISKIVTFFKD